MILWQHVSAIATLRSVISNCEVRGKMAFNSDVFFPSMYHVCTFPIKAWILSSKFNILDNLILPSGMLNFEITLFLSMWFAFYNAYLLYIF
jgi:hypothetical protein